ncbi:MAG: SRPBCC family protein [Bryobacteraceae bacterium]|jgi:uncharacterized protein YndB with AHSA1/START domain
MNQIERKTLIRAPRSRVWHAITDIRQFCKWFSTETTEAAFRPGASVRLISTHPGPYYKMEFFVDIVEMAAEHTFSWRWHPANVIPGEDLSREPMTLVVFRLEEAEGGTLVTVTESGFDQLFPSRIAMVLGENEAGWKYQMAALERYFGDAK